MNQAYRDLQAKIMNPTHLEGYPDERCELGDHDLGSVAFRFVVQRKTRDHNVFGCVDCTREMLVAHYRCTPDSDLAEPPFEFYLAERCDNGCGRFRCRCPEDQ